MPDVTTYKAKPKFLSNKIATLMRRRLSHSVGSRGEERASMVGAWLFSLLAGGTMVVAAFLLRERWAWRSRRMRRTLKRQGVGGPHLSLFGGNIPEMKMIISESKEKKVSLTANYVSFLFPHLERWRAQYGPVFMYSMGSIQMLHISHVSIMKEISQYKPLNLGKPPHLQKEFEPLFGHGIMMSNAALWVHERKVIAPEFFMEKVKGMVSLMVDAMEPLLDTWTHQIDCGGGSAEIVVDDDLRSFSADVISRACFGNSYSQGKDIFLELRNLQKAIAKPGLFAGVTGVSHLPTKSCREMCKIEKQIRSMILNIVKKRKALGGSHEKDFLQSILKGASSDDYNVNMMESFIVDNCKNIYFAGHETTSASATWCLMLLAANPDWQDRAHLEVEQICKGLFPDAEMLKKMKVLTMVIQETLRLYPVNAFVTRGALEDLKLGDLLVPEGIHIRIPIPTLHHDPDMWGQDVHEFKPERFSRGISGACKLPYAYIPFGLGARSCVGQNLAMVELKVALSIILSKFTFSLSPGYHHSPVFRLTVEPEFGVPLVMTKR